MVNVLDLLKSFVKGEPLVFRSLVLSVLAAGFALLHIGLSPDQVWVAVGPILAAVVSRGAVSPVQAILESPLVDPVEDAFDPIADTATPVE